MTTFLQLVLTGILVGGVYSFIGMGFVITYRSTKVFNIAYGQFAYIGALIAWSFIGSPLEPRFPLPLAFLLTFLSVIAFGLLVERLLFRRVIGKPLFVSFILSLGLLALLRGMIVLIWGLQAKTLAPTIPQIQGPEGIITSYNLGNIALPINLVWSFVVAVLAALAFLVFFKKTKLGLAMRAIYDNQIAARCLGVSARLNSQIAWVLCALIATAGGFLMATTIGVSILLSELVLVILAVVLIGGIDSLLGCVIGGLLLSVGKNLLIYYLPDSWSGVEGVFSMLLIMLVLLIRPYGIMGTKPIERV
ncbi:MAG: branched-chain amino acid ABC transporter permease [Chloroflexi bacterium]|jgi:branched-chain amino acid transport system permease protein|nr:branched-chain amino acid ABC transporter permease [Chloroflexota bacterium]MBT7080472.1 branched-chain amino acid ABC transporter permease [Chloroflexota bacterium]MBT7289737.1 branched-chain amino acid ABC transporter permease [Chloroflexota bacterium]